jgi:hypothetical protein
MMCTPQEAPGDRAPNDSWHFSFDITQLHLPPLNRLHEYPNVKFHGMMRYLIMMRGLFIPYDRKILAFKEHLVIP